MLLLQLPLIFALPYISILMSVSGLVSMKKLLHTRLRCELIAHPCREHCRYSEDSCAQGRYCGGSQGVNLPCHGTSSSKHTASVCMAPPGPAGLPPQTQCPYSTHSTWAFQTRAQAHLLVHQPIPVVLRNCEVFIPASCLRGKKVVLFI